MRLAARIRTSGITRAALATCLAALPGAGCGYTTELRLAPDVGSIGVEVFGNDSAYPDLERDLHRELTRSVRNISGAPLAHPEHADLVIRGRLVTYYRRGGIRTSDNDLIESGLRIQVISELWNSAGVKLAGPNTANVNTGYTLDATGHELEARERALKIISDTIVLNLFTEAHALEVASGR